MTLAIADSFNVNLAPLQGMLPKDRIDEYFGVWAYMPDRFLKVAASVGNMNWRAHMQAARPAIEPGVDEASIHSDPFGSPYTFHITSDGIAIIGVAGSLMKQQSSFGGTSTILVRKMVRAAVQDERVKAILLLVDSPGGTVSGTEDLGNEVAAAAKKKPVYAYIEDLGASAAYWTASQATKIFANRSAIVGSIGVIMVMDDSSKAYQNAGIDVHVIATGPFKGAGAEGAPISPEQLEYFQGLVDSANEQFIATVAAGRGVSATKVRGWADGRVHRAPQALEMGLIDGIKSLDETLSLLAKARPPRAASNQAADGGVVIHGELAETLASGEEPAEQATNSDQTATEQEASTVVAEASSETSASERSDEVSAQQEDSMSTTQNGAPSTSTASAAPAAEQPATLAELKAACYGADAEFLMTQLEGKATVAQASQSWGQVLHGRLEQSKADTAAAKTAAAQKGSLGVEAVGNGTAGEEAEFEGDAIAEFKAAQDALMAKGKSKAAAVLAIGKSRPELLKAYNVAVAEQMQERGWAASDKKPARAGA